MVINRKFAKWVSIIGISGVLISACGKGSAENEAFVSGGTFKAALAEEVDSVIPMSASQLSDRQVVKYSYDQLIYADESGDLSPWLAESWESDGTNAEFHLKKGIKCTDGTPFDAAVAADNINFHADPNNESLHHGSRIAEGLEATGEGKILKVKSPNNDPFLAENVGLVEMVCPAGLENPEQLENHSNGTGLFELTEVKPNKYKFEKNEAYEWGPGGLTADTEGVPDNLEVDVITDESTRANLLISGDLNAARVAGNDRKRVEATAVDYTYTIAPVGEMLFNERTDRPTADPLVREALVLGFNHDEAADVLSKGYPLDPESLITNAPFLCVPDEKPEWSLPDTDKSKAEQLLDEAGWELESDGKRRKSGEKLSIGFMYEGTSPTHSASAEIVRESWEDIGISTDLIANDSAGWSERLYETYDWDTGWIQINAQTPALLNNFFDGSTPEDGGVNFMFVDNPRYSELSESALEASPDDTCEYWQAAEKELLDRFDVFPLTYYEQATFMSGATFVETDYIEPTSIRMLE